MNKPEMAQQWRLDNLYENLDDPQIEADLLDLEQRYAAFFRQFRGQLSSDLGAAVRANEALSERSGKLYLYLHLRMYADLNDEAVKKRLFEVKTRLDRTFGEHASFFTIEIAQMAEERFQARLQEPDCAFFRPWLEQVRRNLPYMLSEEVEGALTKRSAFGAESWAEFYDEVEADLRFDYQGRAQTLTEMLHTLNTSQDGEQRAEVQRLVNQGLQGAFSKFSAQTLNMVVGAKRIEDRERGYSHPMQARNLSNKVPDAVVEALHQAVTTQAAPLAQRYYRLKATLLGQKTLRWSDRNAPLPFTANVEIPYHEGLDLVLQAYHSFSPTLAQMVEAFQQQGRFDVAPRPGKQSGAFNYSVVLPGGEPVSYILLNHQGSMRDVMTLAHEVGHGVHGMLAGHAQGALMASAPMAYAETASIFGEMTTFNFLRERLQQAGDHIGLLALLTGKIEDILNSVVRQIGFSNFERRVHGADSRLSAHELDAIWMETTQALYGAEGEVFTYADSNALWSYISHFHRPFYVYAYAFGELLTQSLYASRAGVGAVFEASYLDLLRAGGTKDVVELLKPFALDPTDMDFWQHGIDISLGALIAEAEVVAKQAGVL
ncbi:peptidase M3A and M3B, thimet/oligopeptidase F [Magnetococcus marinus MC-1]|uniref:Peptidase M3A and M3B, thimet/oligopeptidase F n=1 Tax=Magnetococcus marinus (strain ATCC BAA-1437 / JCM 17883 / MC-1) TaxID=156889 RepID=A0L9M7_MAGMM|nr:M3 family oligoendopeptidase [Magnetococcus marinus]ABK44670.1 peptidase M3A and M3B, thimet/oligopeptidase F [Magnetococcus marinus MC-1]